MTDEVESIRIFVQTFDNVDIYRGVLAATKYRLPIVRKNPCNIEERVDIMKRVRQEWTENETLWRTYLNELEKYTKVKSKRMMTGFYMYCDTETGQEIAFSEYESRYLAFAQACKQRALDLTPVSTPQSDKDHDEISKLNESDFSVKAVINAQVSGDKTDDDYTDSECLEEEGDHGPDGRPSGKCDSCLASVAENCFSKATLSFALQTTSAAAASSSDRENERDSPSKRQRLTSS